MTKVALTREGITALLLENDRAVERALIVLFDRQTNAEKIECETRVHNGIGFTAADAHWGTINAKSILAGQRLTPFQLSCWRKRNVRGVPKIAKYWRQLKDAAEQRAEREAMREAA